MKYFRFITLITLLSLTIAACSEKTKNEAEQVGERIESTTNSIGNDIEESKDQFIANAEDEIEALDKKIEELDKKMANVSDDVQAETKKTMESLNTQKERLEKDLESLKNTTRENWRVLASNIESGFDDLKEGYNNLLDKMKAG